MSSKRNDYISWDEFFMGTAVLAGMRSKDGVSQVGACIVDGNKKIVGVGYNGQAYGCSDDVFPWGKDQKDPQKNKHLFVCHAEMNAILHTNVRDLTGFTIYVSLFPCNGCAKAIIQSHIKKVVYFSDKHSHKEETKASKEMLQQAGVVFVPYIRFKTEFTINFDRITKCIPFPE